MQHPRTNLARSARRSHAEWTADAIRWRKSGPGSAEYAAERGLKRSSLPSVALVEKPAHRADLVAHTARTRDGKGRDRLRSEIPKADELMRRWLEDGRNVG